MFERKQARDPRAHRIAHHVGAPNPKMREQVGRVAGHEIGAIGAGRVGLLALPMTAVVERDDPAPGAGQGLDPARVHPVHAKVRGEAVNEQDRLAEIVVLRRGVDEGDIDARGRKILRHRRHFA